MQRFVVFVAGLVVLIALLPPWAVHAAVPTQSLASGGVNPADFPQSTIINNPYFPLTPGTTFTFQGTHDGGVQTEEFVVTHQTKQILGVNCVVIRDTDALTGSVIEMTIDWFAQDRYGNVWYMGEYATTYNHGVVTGHAGSWEAGVSGAQPGIVMLAHPDVGDTYRQEYLQGVAQDNAGVLSLTQSVCVPYDCYYGHVLLTAEWSPLDPGAVENKYYALGIGVVQTADVKGPGSEQMQLIGISIQP